jgi:hypothetical protein
MSNSTMVMLVLLALMTILYVMRRRARLKNDDRD